MAENAETINGVFETTSKIKLIRTDSFPVIDGRKTMQWDNNIGTFRRTGAPTMDTLHWQQNYDPDEIINFQILTPKGLVSY